MIKFYTNIILVILLLLCYTNTNGYNVTQTQDTTKTHILDELATKKLEKKDYKISKREFIKKYAFDGKFEKTIIDYFRKRNIRIISALLSPILTIVIALLITVLIASLVSYTGPFPLFIFALLFIVGIYYSAAFIIYSLTFTKKKLLELLLMNRQKNLIIQKND